MQTLVKAVEDKQRKRQVVDVRSGDTVRVHQKIKEGEKTRTQVFEGLVIKVSNKNSLTSRILVRRISSGVGVEKSFLMHSPLVEKVEVTKRAKVRRNYLTYMRGRSGKATKLAGVDFDRQAVNTVEELRDSEIETEPNKEAVDSKTKDSMTEEKPFESKSDDKADK